MTFLSHKKLQVITAHRLTILIFTGVNTPHLIEIQFAYERGVGVRVPVGSRIFSSPRRPDRLSGPPSLLSNGYRWLFPRG
jgi:hypothetical protein